MSREKQHGLIKGAAILSVSMIIVKLVGFLYSIPLANILDSTAFGYYNITYEVFAIFNAAATAGLPVAVARMVSSAYTKGQKKQADRIFGVAMIAFFVLGLVSSLIMFVFSEPIAIAMNQPGANYSIKALAPTVFFCAIMSAIRGYFQGRSNMTPTAVSQVIEALTKLFIGIGLAAYVVANYKESSLSAAAAILGVSVSAGLGTLYLSIYKRRQTKRDLENPDVGDETITRRKDILSSLVRFAVPITIGTCFIYALNMIDASIINGRLQTIAGISDTIASDYYGYWSAALKIFDLPGAIVIALSTSLLPVLTAAFVRGDKVGVNRITSASLKFTFLVTIPSSVGFILFAKHITGLFYFSKGELAYNSGVLLTIAAIAVIFNGVMYTTNAAMQSLGHVITPVVNMAIGGLVKIVLNYWLIAIPEINIMGAAISTVVSYAVMMILNFIAIYRWIPDITNPWKMVFPILLASLAMGAVSYPVFLLVRMLLGTTIALIVAILLAVVAYIFFIVLFKAVKYEDVKMMPKGEKLVKLLRMKPTPGAEQIDGEV